MFGNTVFPANLENWVEHLFLLTYESRVTGVISDIITSNKKKE